MNIRPRIFPSGSFCTVSAILLFCCVAFLAYGDYFRYNIPSVEIMLDFVTVVRIMIRVELLSVAAERAS